MSNLMHFEDEMVHLFFSQKEMLISEIDKHQQVILMSTFRYTSAVAIIFSLPREQILVKKYLAIVCQVELGNFGLAGSISPLIQHLQKLFTYQTLMFGKIDLFNNNHECNIIFQNFNNVLWLYIYYICVLNIKLTNDSLFMNKFYLFFMRF